MTNPSTHERGTTRRPGPETFLDRARHESARANRGRLTIFFGAAPGVGKTYAMLAAANRLAAEGHDVVIGLVETHGRAETERQLLGLDILPRRAVEYRGVTLKEFDVDAALARHPEILVVDELAHTNAPGLRAGKRHEDVEELLKAGVSVFTTLNVQHLESLNDVVERITGIAVRETVPDAVFDEADEVELVDLPPRALLERLRAGKVYLPESARLAADSFFRPGNLTALRELALRRTAEWVDRQMERYQRGEGIRAVWPAADRVLVCVSPSPLAPRLVRAARRLAAGLRADLIAAYVETSGSGRLPQADRDRVMATLRLAEEFGAEAVTLAAPAGSTDAVGELVAFARARNVSRIVLGKTERSRWTAWLRPSFMDELIRRSGDIDVQVIRAEEDSTRTESASDAVFRATARPRPVLRRAAGAGCIVAVATLLSWLAYRPPDLSEEAMIYLGGVVVAAWRFGRVGALVATILSVAAFNFFLTDPRFTFRVNEPLYLITFAVMLVVGLGVGTLTARIRDQAREARDRELRAAALYAMTRQLAAARDRREIASVAVRHVHETFGADVALLAVSSPARPQEIEVLSAAGSPDFVDDRERSVARWALEHGRAAGLGTPILAGARARHVPVSGSRGRLAVLAVRPEDPGRLLAPARLLLLETFADQVGLALERVVLLESQQTARIEVERERLRSALLSSVSHDLRTPLASIAGAAGALLESDAELDPGVRSELLRGILDESRRLGELIGNLIFATELESGIRLRREWTTIEEIVAAGLARHRDRLGTRALRVAIPADLPLVRVDGLLVAQVVHNLVENALRYTGPGTPILVDAWATDTSVILRVADEGAGLAADEDARVFERFYRGRAAVGGAERGRGGLGLGLTICRGVVEAHGGRIWAEPNVPQGAAFLIALPREEPQPRVPAEPLVAGET